MSTRYVYGVYNTTASSETLDYLVLKKDALYNTLDAKLSQDYESSIWKNPDGSYVTRYDSNPYSGDIKWIIRTSTGYNPGSISARIVDYPYAIIELYTIGQSTGKIIGLGKLLEATSSSGTYWLTKSTADGQIEICTTDDVLTPNYNPSSAVKKPFKYTGGKIQKGSTLLSTKTSSSSSLTTGPYMEGSQYRWLAYRGSDSIDPDSVSYPDDTLAAGDELTVTVSPKTPAFGGTIYYQYAYSTNGGSSWTSLGSRTTSTSRTVTIPQGVNQYRVRVIASDNYGFTSSTSVMGPNLTVLELKAYLGIEQKARAVSRIYIGVGGKAREVVKGYIGVDGKARKFM